MGCNVKGVKAYIGFTNHRGKPTCYPGLLLCHGTDLGFKLPKRGSAGLKHYANLVMFGISGNIEKVIFKFGKQSSPQHGVFHQFLEQKGIPADNEKVPHKTMEKS